MIHKVFRKWRLYLTLVLSIGLSFLVLNWQTAQAEILINHGLEVGSFGILSDFDGTYFSGSQQIGSPVNLSQDCELERLTWSGQYFPQGQPLKDQFSVQFFEITEGIPASQAILDLGLETVNRSDSGIRRFDHPVFTYSAQLNSISLKAGQYLISIINNTHHQADDWLWMTAELPNQAQNVQAQEQTFFRDSNQSSWKVAATGKMSLTLSSKFSRHFSSSLLKLLKI